MNKERTEAKMSDREALAAALATTVGYKFAEQSPLPLLIAAARERLAQLPEKCGRCGGDGIDRSTVFPGNCPSCHGSGKVYPAELVERIAKAVWLVPQNRPDYRAWTEVVAVAVLDALNGETE